MGCRWNDWSQRSTLFLGCYEHIWQAPKKSGALVDVVEMKEIFPRLASAATNASSDGPSKAFWGTSLKSQVAKH